MKIGSFRESEAVNKHAFTIVSAVLSLCINMFLVFLTRSFFLELPAAIIIAVAYIVYAFANIFLCIGEKVGIKYRRITCIIAAVFGLAIGILFSSTTTADFFKSLKMTNIYTQSILICAFIMISLLLVMPITTATNIKGDKVTDIIVKCVSAVTAILGVYIAIGLCIYGATGAYTAVENTFTSYFENVMIGVVVLIPSVLAIFNKAFTKADHKSTSKISERKN